MRTRRLIVASCLFAILMYGCSVTTLFPPAATPSPEIPPTQTAAPTLEPTATPINVSGKDVCQHTSEEVTISGSIYVPPVVAANQPTYLLDLEVKDDSAPVFVLVQVGDGNNQVEPLHDGYRVSDLVITTNSGKQVGNKSPVTVSGKVKSFTVNQMDKCMVIVEEIVYNR